MARIRTTKPEFWTDEKIVNLPYETRLFFMGLWSFADDCGHVEDEPLRLKLQILPNDDVDAKKLIETLISVGVLKRLKGCLLIPNFRKHQKIDKPSKCRFSEDSTKARRGSKKPPRKPASTPPRKGREGNGGESKGASLAPKAAREELFEAIARACGIETSNGGLTDSSRGALNKAVKELLQAQATPTSVFQRARNYRTTYPGMTLTPSALAKHWPQLERAQPPPTQDRVADMARSLAAREEDSDGSIDTTARPHGRSLPQGSRG